MADTLSPMGHELARIKARHKLTDKQLAASLNVTEHLLYRWQRYGAKLTHWQRIALQLLYKHGIN